MPPCPHTPEVMNLSPQSTINTPTSAPSSPGLTSLRRSSSGIKQSVSFVDLQHSTSLDAGRIIKHKIPPSSKLQQPVLHSTKMLSYDDEPKQNNMEFASTVQSLSERVEHLLEDCDREESSSPVRDACLTFLRTRMSLVLKQATVLVENAEKGNHDDTARIVERLRCSFALVAAVQLTDALEYGMSSCETRYVLDQQLTTILDNVKNKYGGDLEGLDDILSFRVSPWVTTSLDFELPVGKPARTTLKGDGHRSLPLNLEVEPVVSFEAKDLSSDKSDLGNLRLCHVDIEECKHRPREFSEGAGTIGVAFVRVHVYPLEEKCPKFRVWGVEEEVEKLRIKENRVIQLNAWPPTPMPRASTDLYTSYIYGSSGISVTMIIKTCVTDTSDAAPNIKIELILAP